MSAFPVIRVLTRMARSSRLVTRGIAVFVPPVGPSVKLKRRFGKRNSAGSSTRKTMLSVGLAPTVPAGNGAGVTSSRPDWATPSTVIPAALPVGVITWQ